MLVLAATVVAALAVAFIMPKKYVAPGDLMVDARDEQTMRAARACRRASAPAYVATQIDLHPERHASPRKVARDLKLAQQPGVREEWENDTGGVGTIEEWIGDHPAAEAEGRTPRRAT